MNIWPEIEKLQGKTLNTLDSKKPFDVVYVGEQRVIVRPHVRKVERPIRRECIEGAYSELRLNGEISRCDIRDRYTNFNPAYVAAILASLPGVTYLLKPIRLYYQ
jgi:hypothetical protein